MNPSSRSVRTPSRLPGSVHRQLNMYALAASAAGVSLLAFARTAEGRIVYTRTHDVIVPGSMCILDLAHDKTPDFTITNIATRNTSGTSMFYLQETPANGNGALGSVSQYAAALKPRARIGPSAQFLSQRGWLAAAIKAGTHLRTGGPWVNVTNRYLGLKFLIKGKTHYGWARMTVKVKGTTITATLTGYAFETIPHKAIIAGKTKGPDVIAVQPASLGHLAQGSAGLTAWRSGK